MTIKKQETVRRYVFLFIGLFINALGVSLITKANLGTSPITSIPYVLSEAFGLSIGMFTFFINIIFFIFHIIIFLRKF